MPSPYSTIEEQYKSALAPCIYCALGKCAERKAAGLCHCGDHAETPAKADETPTVRTSAESELVTAN